MRQFRGWVTDLITSRPRRRAHARTPDDFGSPLTHDALTRRAQHRLVTASRRQLLASRTEVMAYLFTGPDLDLLGSRPTKATGTGKGRPTASSLGRAHPFDLFVFTGPNLSAAALLGTRARDPYSPLLRDDWVGWDGLDVDQRTLTLTSAYRNLISAPHPARPAGDHRRRRPRRQQSQLHLVA